MSWTLVNPLKKLIVRVGGTDYTEKIIISPDLPAKTTEYLNQYGPYNSMWSSGIDLWGYTNWSSEDAIRYAQIAALTIPESGIDLIKYGKLAGNGNDFYIFREETGIDYRIAVRLTINSDNLVSSRQLRFIFAGNEVGAHGWSGGAQSSAWLGFLTDGTDTIPYFRGMYAYDTGQSYHGYANECVITAAPNISGNNKTSLTNLCNLLVVGNDPPSEPHAPEGFSFYGHVVFGSSADLPDATAPTIPNPYTTSFSFEGKCIEKYSAPNGQVYNYKYSYYGVMTYQGYTADFDVYSNIKIGVLSTDRRAYALYDGVKTQVDISSAPAGTYTNASQGTTPNDDKVRYNGNTGTSNHIEHCYYSRSGVNGYTLPMTQQDGYPANFSTTLPTFSTESALLEYLGS